MSSLFKRACDIISDFKPFHSEYQIDNIIIGSSGFGDDSDETAFGIWLQMQREIQSRLSALSAQRSEVHRMQVAHLAEQRRASAWFCWTKLGRLRRAIAQSEVDRLAFELSQLQHATEALARELAHFVERAEAIQNRVRAWSADKSAQIEMRWWMRRYERRLAAAELYRGSSAETIEGLVDLPESTRQRLRKLAQVELSGTVPRLTAALNNIQNDYGRHNRELVSARPHPSALEDSGLQRSFPREALAYQASRSGHASHPAD